MTKQVTISSKNQITLPSALLRSRNLSAGQKLYIVEQGDNITLSSKTPIDRYIDAALVARKNKTAPKDIVDPLKVRQELRDNWEER